MTKNISEAIQTGGIFVLLLVDDTKPEVDLVCLFKVWVRSKREVQ